MNVLRIFLKYSRNINDVYYCPRQRPDNILWTILEHSKKLNEFLLSHMYFLWTLVIRQRANILICTKGVRNVRFLGKFNMLYFLVTTVSRSTLLSNLLRFTVLPYYRRTILSTESSLLRLNKYLSGEKEKSLFQVFQF